MKLLSYIERFIETVEDKNGKQSNYFFLFNEPLHDGYFRYFGDTNWEQVLRSTGFSSTIQN